MADKNAILRIIFTIGSQFLLKFIIIINNNIQYKNNKKIYSMLVLTPSVQNVLSWFNRQG